MPDVKMPDGTIIRNVPDGTTRAQLMARYGKAPQAPKQKGGSFGHGLADSLTLGFLDEAGAVLDTLGLPAGEKRPNIFSGSGFRDAYQQNLQRNRQILKEKQQASPGEFLAGQIGGALVPVGAGKGRLAQAFKSATTGKKATVAGRTGQIALSAAPDVARGAAYGAGSAEGDLAERAKGGLSGAGQGLAGHTAGRALGAGTARVLKGKNVSPAVRELADAGVVMTPGQRAGAGSIRKNLEEGVLGSIPLVKNIPKAAKRRGIEQLNVAMANKVLEPIGVRFSTKTKPGREFVDQVGQAAYDAYDASMNPLSLNGDSGIASAAKSIIKSAKATVGPNADQLAALVGQTLSPLQRGKIQGGQVRDLMSDLRRQASSFAGSQSANERNLGKELWKLHDHLDAALVRQNGGAQIKKFKDAREAVNRYKRFADATSKAADGIANPTQFRQAATRRGFGVTTEKVARGKGGSALQPLADAAKQVLPDTLPNSGSPERLLAVGGATGSYGVPGITALMDPTGGMATAAVGGGLLPYAPGVDRLLQNLAINRPDLLVKLGNMAERTTPALGTAGAMTSVGINSRP